MKNLCIEKINKKDKSMFVKLQLMRESEKVLVGGTEYSSISQSANYD